MTRRVQLTQLLALRNQKGHEPRNVSSLWKLEKVKKQILIRACRRNTALGTSRFQLF